jgi:two-component system, NarL family, invasion response regulator UvrY
MATRSGNHVSSPSVGVVVVDDHAVFRRAAWDVIGATAGFHALGEASSGEEALRIADRVEPDLVLVDLRMPGLDGVETARRLRAAHPGAVVVLVSTEDPANVPRAAETCGAAAYVHKSDFCPGALNRLWQTHARSLP